MKKVTSFWNWFQDNEETIFKSVSTGQNQYEVFFHLTRNCNYISKKITYLIEDSEIEGEKPKIIFTAKGIKKYIPTLIAIEQQAPKLKHFKAQAFIKPFRYKSVSQKGKEHTFNFFLNEFKLSDLFFSLIDYNYNKKQLSIEVHIPNYYSLKNFNCIPQNIDFILMWILGEIDFKNHIHLVKLTQSNKTDIGLLNILELNDYIKYLTLINPN